MVKEYLSDQVVEYVLSCSEEVLRSLTVSSLARRFYVDRSHLAREFKSRKNLTLFQFLQGEKMARAALLLRDSNDITVEKLSEELGFSSAEYFREVFKKHFAITPTKYRRFKNGYLRNQCLTAEVSVST